MIESARKGDVLFPVFVKELSRGPARRARQALSSSTLDILTEVEKSFHHR